MGYIDITKQSKKVQKAYHAQFRHSNGFNTGTRDMGKSKDKKFAEILDKEIKKHYN